MADMSAKASGTEISFRHTKNVADRIEDAERALAMWRTSVDEWKVFNEHLLTMRVTDAQREEFIERFVPAPEAAIVSKRVMTNIERSEEHTSELQSLMRISYAVFCLKKKKNKKKET